MLGWHPGAAGEEEKSQFLVSPPSWVPWSPSEHTFSDCFIPPAAVATPAFPISPHHLSSASTCLLTLCGGCLWNTPPPRWPPGFLPALLLYSCSACDAGDLGSIPESGRSPGEGNGNPLQYSCLENSMDRGAWQATVHGVAQSQT